MIRFDITEMNSSSVERREEIQTFTMTTNEELCLEQLKKEPNYPCRISIEVLFQIPYRDSDAEKSFSFMGNNENIEHDQNTGNLLKTSIKARAFKSYKKFFNLPS